jgi:hypothetical protein
MSKEQQNIKLTDKISLMHKETKDFFSDKANYSLCRKTSQTCSQRSEKENAIEIFSFKFNDSKVK